MAKMKLALVQFQSVLGDVEASMARALPMIDEAAAAGANMVVFPELFTTGYHLDTVGPRMTELAEPIDGPTVHALQGSGSQKPRVYRGSHHSSAWAFGRSVQQRSVHQLRRHGAGVV